MCSPFLPKVIFLKTPLADLLFEALFSPTLEALVDSRGKGVSNHHCSGVDDDFSASAL